MEGISKEDLENKINELYQCSDRGNYAINGLSIGENIAVLKALLNDCKELDPWLPIEESIVDNKEYLFITRNKKQRVDRFHPSQYATKNTDLHWQERPGDRYTHYQELPPDPKD